MRQVLHFAHQHGRRSYERTWLKCLERKRFACVDHEYSRLAKDDLPKTLRLARFQVGQHRYDDAGKTFSVFFQKGGSDAEAAFLFARVLAHQGRAAEASQYFKYVLNSQPDAILRSAAIEGYAQLKRLSATGGTDDEIVS